MQLDLQIGKVNLRDRFEWDLANDSSAAPEVFSRQLASELGIGGEFVAIIAHAIREQLYRHKKQLVDEVRVGKVWGQCLNGPSFDHAFQLMQTYRD